MVSKKAKYARGLASRKTAVDDVSSANVRVLIMRARLMRNGYDAEYWMLVRMMRTPRFVTVKTVVMADRKLASIQASPVKREAKYGAAARNMFLVNVRSSL